MFRGPVFDVIDWLTGSGSAVTAAVSVFSVLVIIFVVFPIHECAHAAVASWLGDDTAERQGRLTLNPFVHIDPLGALMMFLCSIGWANPTPVDLRRCTKVKIRTANVLVSAAGPISNILISLIFIIIYKLVIMSAGEAISETVIYVCFALQYTATVNVYLAVLNLLPIPPFDGYHVLASFLPAKSLYFFEKNGHIIRWVLLILMFTGLLGIPISIVSNGIMWLLDKATFFLG